MPRTLSILVWIVMTATTLPGQEQPFVSELYKTYDSYKVSEITSRRLNHDQMVAIIGKLRSEMPDLLKVEEIGRSDEGRSILLLTLGTGPGKVFLWSQMHGDEPTATMGIMDVLSFISRNPTRKEVKEILSKTTLLIIPMLNPDGAQRFQRRSVQGIDINRDARALQTAEAKILKETRDRFNPEFGFNLHDQEPQYTVGQTGKVATIALLAPAVDYVNSDNPVRIRAKHVAAELVAILKPYIDGHISRYDDSFEPRAFGDNIQKWGTSTVLIESGGWPDDPEKMYIRKLNAVALLGVLSSIATGAYEQSDLNSYLSLPQNFHNLCDIIVEGITLSAGDSIAPVTVDVGIDEDEVMKPDGTILRTAKVVEIGDLSTFQAFRRIDGKGRKLTTAEIRIDKPIDVDRLFPR